VSEHIVPRISVIMPCYNAVQFLEEALCSVLGQDRVDLEVILVDDGSTDDPESVVRRLGDHRVRYLRTPASGGPSRPRNLGIAQARGRFVFFFDADDVMMPGKLSTQVALMTGHPELAMSFTNFKVVSPLGATIVPDFLAGYETFHQVRRLGPGDNGGLQREALFLALLRANFIGTSGVAVRRDVLERVGGFDVDLASSEDVDLWLRIARDHDCGYVDIVGHAYRQHPASLMHQFEARHPLSRIEVIRRRLPDVSDPLTRRVMSRRLADNHVNLGFIAQVQGDAALARRHYLDSLRLAPTTGAIGGYLKCLIGGPFLRRGRKAGP
jgi:glycosyltransferase involved in cell wall biosynthesis